MKNPPVHIYGHKFSTFVRTVMLICEEKQIPYTVGLEVNDTEIKSKSEAHFNLHPFGKFPVLLSGELKLPETASICRYLDNSFNEQNTIQLQPNDPEDKARHDALCALISIDVDKALVRDYLVEFAFPKGENGEVRIERVNKAREKVAKTLSIVASFLESSGVMLTAEDFTIADALLAPILTYLQGLPTGYNLLPDYPIIEKYVTQIMTRPSCKKVLVIKEF
jgi:glutathione S-transferase